MEGSRRLDIETLVRAVQGYPRGTGQIAWRDGFAVSFEWRAENPQDAWIHLRFDGRQHKGEQRVKLCRVQPHFGGDRWWFICPKQNWRVRMLYLPSGAELFASRRAYRLAYRSQRESFTDRAIRRARKIKVRLGGDEALLGKTPDKPLRMRWTTYRRLTKQLAAAEQAAYERLRRKLARWAQ